MGRSDVYCLLTGFAVVHPSFDRPSSANSQMLFSSVSHFENFAGFADVLQLMLRLALLALATFTYCSCDPYECWEFLFGKFICSKYIV